MYEGGRYASHSRFSYFALNTEMQRRALLTRRVYIHQNPEDAHLSVDELCDMVGHDGDKFSHWVLHYASSL